MKEEEGIERTAAAILAIWREVLGIADVGIDENFFDIGGSSLLATRIAGRLSLDLGRNVSAADILANPSVRSLAAAITGQASAMNRGQAERRAAMQQQAFAARRATRG